MKNCKGAAIIIFKRKDNNIEVLLGKRKYFPNIGYWSIPGGKMENCDDSDFKKTAIRECEEETGIKVTSDLILLEEIRDNNFIWNTYLFEVPYNINNLFKEEVLSSDWFDINNLPNPLVDLIENQIREAAKIILNK